MKTNVRNQTNEGTTMGQVLKVDQDKPDEGALVQAAEMLRGQGVLVLPTDSVYGIGCAATHGNPARERVFRIKERPADMTLPWLIADTADLARYGDDIPEWALALTANFWPGALTVVVRASRRVPAEYQRADTHTIALRMPDSELVRDLARRVRVPLAVTSANTHGAAPAVSGAAVETRLVEEVDLTLDAGPAPIAIPSTIVDCTGAEPHILREGAIPAADILRVAGV
ncbi:MAG: L-threonylcarbamoyladenylate synthase [Olegusella sp.]|nr:L-threonylcarbamoyladenylate synthase [Olegusella sp.]